MAAPEKVTYQFGLEPPLVAKRLREIADQIEGGELVPQEMSDVVASNIGDFTFRKVFVKFGIRKV